ncbi:MAG: nitroreductase family protein [Deltaproteobacteria bacterium]|nr:nitroreductase family protein [Deltaproteobacteria bacterium]MBW1961413.1 nitroreductase family protein [Deltaproteobacteria bacterium]MBW2152752.1 nitroreductase family protein [Deltaproteobacteria bacterium]
MADFMDIVKRRRSVRNFQDREVAEDILNQILETVRWTPSWANTQCWEIIWIKDRSIREKLQATMSKGNPATKSIVNAPVLLALCAKLQSSGYYKGEVTTKFGDWFMYDLGLANQTLCLAAENFGLGTVVVGLFDHDRAKEILKVPDGYELVTLIPMGYPAKTPSAPKRREVNEFLHHDTF